MKEPKRSVELMTRARTLVTTKPYSEKKCSALIARPRAIAPRIIPTYDKKTHSLNFRLRSEPSTTKTYWTRSTEVIRAMTISTSSMPMKDGDQSVFGALNIPRPMYEKIKASAKYPNVWNVTALTYFPCGDRLYQAY